MKKTIQRFAGLLTDLSKREYIPLAMRIASVFLFTIIIAALFYGSIRVLSYSFTSKAAMIAVWLLWWPFLYITLFFFARLWCGFLCPLSIANEAGNYLHKGKAINYRRWAFVPFVLFFLIVYFEEASGLFLSVPVTLYLFVLSFLVSFLIGLILPRWSFCKLVCPIGTLLGVFSRLSVIGLRTKKEVCDRCTNRVCLIGGKANPCPMYNNVPTIDSNKDCLLCANCIKNCPNDSAHITMVRPGEEIEKKIGFTMSESYFITALFGMALILTNNGTLLARKILSLSQLALNGPILKAADFLIGIGLFVGAFTLLGYLCAKLMKAKPANFLSESGYYYLPTVFFIMFYTIFFGFLGPLLPVSEAVIAVSKYAFLAVGVLWSAYLIKKMCSNRKVRALQLIFLTLIAALWAGVLIYDPLHIVTEKEKQVVAKSGEEVSLTAYSMGFDPAVIMAEKGSPVVLNVTNKDITHAFDIEEFGVHYILKGGNTMMVMFTPNKTGEFEFHCSIPGHTEAGMKGRLIIVDKLE